MIAGALKYGALITKIHAIKGTMFNDERYRQLAASVSVAEAVEFIAKNSSYGRYISDYGAQMHRETLEKLLKNAVYDDYKRLANYLDKKDTMFVRAAMCRYEIGFLKNLIRNCMSDVKVKNFSVYEASQAFRNAADFDADALIKANNMESLISALEGSMYYDVIAVLYSRGRKPTLFEIETNLDIFYYKHWQTVMRSCLKGKIGAELNKVVGSDADMLNILWVYRCKHYYKLPNEIIYTLLIPVHNLMTPEKIRKIVEAEDFDAALAEIKYSGIFKNHIQATYERVQLKYIADAFKHISREKPYSVSVVMNYLYSKELEIENICSIIESIRYNLSKEKIMEYVVS